jgi:hypothetical protein
MNEPQFFDDCGRNHKRTKAGQTHSAIDRIQGARQRNPIGEQRVKAHVPVKFYGGNLVGTAGFAMKAFHKNLARHGRRQNACLKLTALPNLINHDRIHLERDRNAPHNETPVRAPFNKVEIHDLLFPSSPLR